MTTVSERDPRAETAGEPCRIFYACLVTDGFSMELNAFFDQIFVELGRSGGRLLHYYNLGNPRVFDQIYDQMRTPELRLQDEREAREFEETVQEAGGWDVCERREMAKLAELLGVADARKPCLVFFKTPPFRKITERAVDVSVLDDPRTKRAFGQFLCAALSEERLRAAQYDASGRDSDVALQTYLSEALEPISAVAKLDPSLVVDLSTDQIVDYARFEYKCRDRIHIQGLVAKRRRNFVIVNGVEVLIGDRDFTLLLHLLVALQEGHGGWVTSPGNYQAIDRVRKCFSGRLLKDNSGEFIENDGAKRYRVSTHPDLVSYDRAKLVRHPDPLVANVAARLP